MDSSTYKSTVAEAFNDAAARYDRLGVEFFTPMGRRLVAVTALRPGDRVLDVGCGRGACVFPAAEVVGPAGRVLGIDIAEEMIAEAGAEARRLDLSTVEFQVMDGEFPRLPPRSRDVVLGSYSLIFLPDAPAALPRYANILADGGRIGFTSPVFTEDTFPFLPPVFTELIPSALLENLPPEWQPAELRRRFNRWLQDPADVVATMERAGFTKASVVDEPIDMVSPDGRTWVDWSHTQGMRLLWRHLPADENAALRSRLIGALDAMREGTGPLAIEVPVRFVTGTRAR